MNAPPHHPQSPEEWEREWDRLNANYEGLEWIAWVKTWCLESVYFLLRFVLSTSKWKNPDRGDPLFSHQWFYDRCIEFQFDSAGSLTILPRSYGKSTMLTFGWVIWRIISNPGATIGIFSITLPIATKFTAMLKLEMETNELLCALFPEVFWGENPKSQGAAIWKSTEMTVKRPTVFKDATIQAYGLLDTSFTGARITDGIYDDCVNEKVVTNADMVQKTVDKWRLSLNIGFPGTQRRMVGTWYAAGDPYHEMVKSGVNLHMLSCYDINYRKSVITEGTGIPRTLVVDREKPNLWSVDHLEREEQLMGPVTFAIQYLCNPSAYELTDFRRDWVQYYNVDPEKFGQSMPTIMVIDQANERNSKTNSRTAIWIVALGPDKNFYLVDGLLDRVNITERGDAIFAFHRKWNPVQVRLEKYANLIDDQYLKEKMQREKYHFNLELCSDPVKKEDRIRRLVPIFQNGRMFFPRKLVKFCPGDNEMRDLVDHLVEWEIAAFPNAVHVDGLDSLSRIAQPDMLLPWPKEKATQGPMQDAWRKEFYKKTPKYSGGLTWMSNG